MNNEEAKQILIRYNEGQCSEAEKEMVESSFLQYNEDEIDISQERIVEIGNHIYSELSVTQKTTKKINLWPGIAAIAAITLLTVGSWHIYDRFVPPTRQAVALDIGPGGNKATLKLGNGETINLSNAKSGVIINGKNLSYLDGTPVLDKKEEENSLVMQTLSTPTGGQYHIILPDGTKVWLNATSSLTYPTSFANKNERKIELTGEAYFEVAHNKTKPFLVKTAIQTVEVFGTHFNVNSYNDNGTTITTLTEGSVSVSNLSSKKAMLKPGQQSLTSGKDIRVQNADIETDLAWKNGRIEFKDANIQTILKQAARWYDIDIEYQGKLPNRVFDGSISRESNLSVLLKILEYSNVHFTIAQEQNSRKKLIVTP